jgi:hypothetical protein
MVLLITCSFYKGSATMRPSYKQVIHAGQLVKRLSELRLMILNANTKASLLQYSFSTSEHQAELLIQQHGQTEWEAIFQYTYPDGTWMIEKLSYDFSADEVWYLLLVSDLHPQRVGLLSRFSSATDADLLTFAKSIFAKTRTIYEAAGKDGAPEPIIYRFVAENSLYEWMVAAQNFVRRKYGQAEVILPLKADPITGYRTELTLMEKPEGGWEVILSIYDLAGWVFFQERLRMDVGPASVSYSRYGGGGNVYAQKVKDGFWRASNADIIQLAAGLFVNMAATTGFRANK